MALTEQLQRTLTGFIFESAIIILVFTILVLIRRHYARRKTKYTQQMYYIFMCFTFAIIFSWLSKLIILLLGAEGGFESIDPNIPFFWLMTPILQFRVSFVFMAVAAYFTFRLGGRIFDLNRHVVINSLVVAFTAGNILFSLFFVGQGKGTYDIIAFLLALVEMIIGFVPFGMHSFKMGKRLHEKLYKKASFSLGIMSVSFIFIFVGFLLDRILIILFAHPGYSIFYFAAWTMSIVGMFSAYLGYIRPGEKQHLAVQARKEAEAESELITSESGQ